MKLETKARPPKWEDLSEDVRTKFKKGFDKVVPGYYDSTHNSDNLKNVFNVNDYIEDAYLRKFISHQYPKTAEYLYDALKKYSRTNKSDVVFGSITPWYELIVLLNSCRSCTTIEYNVLNYNDKRLKTFTVDKYEA